MSFDRLVDFIVRDMSHQVLLSDGGNAELVDVTEDGVAVIRFEPGRNEECADCVMTAEDFGAMLLERIQWKVPSVRDLRFTDAASAGCPPPRPQPRK